MAQNNNAVSKAPKAKQPTAAEMRSWYMNHKEEIDEFAQMKSNFAKAVDPLIKLRDENKAITRTISTFDREMLRQYFENIGAYQTQLRNLSWYLYYRCQPYARLIHYYANMLYLPAKTIVPTYNFTKTNDKKKMLKSYNATCDVVEKMNLQYEMLKMYILCWIQDVAFGCAYLDKTGMFILPIPSDICRISGVYSTSDFMFHVDMSYFRSRRDTVEMWGEPWVSMMREYDKDPLTKRWVQMPPEYSVCLKYRCEDWEAIVPPLAGLFDQLVSLLDAAAVQAISDQQEIFKMVWLEMETLDGNVMNNWKIDPEIYITYFNKMLNEALPDYISAAIVPGKLDSISFDETDKTNDSNKISKATKTVFNSGGGAQVLNSESISGTTAYKFAAICDTEYAISSLLPQTESFVNRMLIYHVSGTPCKVKFFPISTYTRDEFRDTLLKQAQSGLPVKTAIMSLDGFAPKDVSALNYLEEEVLDLTNKFTPLKTSYTQGNDNGELKSPEELTDEGERSREGAGVNG